MGRNERGRSRKGREGEIGEEREERGGRRDPTKFENKLTPMGVQ